MKSTLELGQQHNRGWGGWESRFMSSLQGVPSIIATDAYYTVRVSMRKIYQTFIVDRKNTNVQIKQQWWHEISKSLQESYIYQEHMSQLWKICAIISWKSLHWSLQCSLMPLCLEQSSSFIVWNKSCKWAVNTAEVLMGAPHCIREPKKIQ